MTQKPSSRNAMAYLSVAQASLAPGGIFGKMPRSVVDLVSSATKHLIVRIYTHPTPTPLYTQTPSSTRNTGHSQDM